MRHSFIWVLLLLTAAGGSYAGTHVNISFSQQHAKNMDTSVADKAQFEADSFEQFRSVGQFDGDYQSERSARIQEEKKDEEAVKHMNHKADDSSISSVMSSDSRLDRQQAGHVVVQPSYQYRNMYNSNPIEYQRNSQFRKMNDQQKQNMEFERYIQHYHSGPTVETVFDTSDAKPKHPAHVNDGSQAQLRSGKLVMFERQVALPAQVAPSEGDKQVQPIGQSQPVQASSSSSASTSSSVPVVSVAGANNNNFRPVSVGSDGLNFDQSTGYNKPNYNDQTSFKYNDDSDDHFHNQYPPSVEEPQGGYGGYYHHAASAAGNEPNINFYDNTYGQGHGHNNYLPPEAMNTRPVVTKTIQIAQPAIKAKTYEVRHPAVQKEFYDIEERVLIKPAGTVVVELERPVAKIPKGESILPLGQPHPAVAGAYMNNGNAPSFSNIIYSEANNQANGPHNPSSVYNTQHEYHRPSGSTLASSITSTPTFEQSFKEVAVEANLNKQYNGENHFTPAAAPVVDDSKTRNREVVVITDGQGRQRQVSPEQFTYSRDETDRAPSRSGYNLRSYSNRNAVPQRPNFQARDSNRNEYDFEAEYINNAGNGNTQRDSKPARLQDFASTQMQHKHEIHLHPSPHNIYLANKNDIPQSRYVEERAHVQEVKPYLLNHPGPIVVYASNKPQSSLRSGSEYQPQSQVVNYRNSERPYAKFNENKRPEISAPYAQMRFNPDNQKNQNHREFSASDRDSRKYGRLILDDKAPTNIEMKPNNMNMTESQAHIEINIPHTVQDSNKPITVSSTIRPMMSGNEGDMHKAKLEISVTNNGEPQMVSSNIDSDMSERFSNSKDDIDFDKKASMVNEPKFMRIVEASSDAQKEGNLASESASSNIQSNNVDVNVKGSSGHIVSPGSNSGHHVTPGSRVIAATPAPKEASASESFHKRRIVVNHPFQTVREVVEHEPYTNYHEVQVKEHASPALYHNSAAYFQANGALRQHHSAAPVYYH